MDSGIFTDSSQFHEFGGLNHTLFKFTVYTNAGINFGGATSSGGKELRLTNWYSITREEVIMPKVRSSMISTTHQILGLIPQTVG